MRYYKKHKKFYPVFSQKWMFTSWQHWYTRRQLFCCFLAPSFSSWHFLRPSNTSWARESGAGLGEIRIETNSKSLQDLSRWFLTLGRHFPQLIQEYKILVRINKRELTVSSTLSSSAVLWKKQKLTDSPQISPYERKFFLAEKAPKKLHSFFLKALCR